MSIPVSPASIDVIGLALRWSADSPVALAGIHGTAFSFGRGPSLVEIFTAVEQRARTSQGYVHSAVGDRLRYQGHEVEQMTPEAGVLTLSQVDPATEIRVETRIERRTLHSYRVTHRVYNGGVSAVVLTAVTSAVIGVGADEDDLDNLDLVHGSSEWLAEGRWRREPLRTLVPRLKLSAKHHQDGRGRFTVTSHGSWSTGERLPTGILIDRTTDAAIAWQLETSGPWHWEVVQDQWGAALSALGPTDLEHQFAHELVPGASFDTVPLGIAVTEGGLDGAAAELTAYRRTLRVLRPIDARLPLIYNDYMNTLLGDPTTEKLLPLIDAAADAGAEYFCIDAGWFAEPGSNWWSAVGEWREDPTRFTGGLRAVIDHIHKRGMVSGLWLEPEVVGIDSPVARSLPEDAFFQRFGTRVVEDHRYHLDFRHPAARQHLDETVDHLVHDYGVGFLKFDYNINPGAGTELGVAGAGDGLLQHTRAFIEWLKAVQSRHPELLIENCASGAMRMDYALLAVTHLQSTSDQEDILLSAAVAAAAPLSILPEQCGNWAYPSADMSIDATVFSLIAGLVGRMYLSGFLHLLSDQQRALVGEATALHRSMREFIARATPFWPLGLPGWDDELLALGLRDNEHSYVAVWSRAAGPREVTLPGARGTVETAFPTTNDEEWTIDSTSGDVRLGVPAGPVARLFRLG
jgi:alpha-galactosidase